MEETKSVDAENAEEIRYTKTGVIITAEEFSNACVNVWKEGVHTLEQVFRPIHDIAVENGLDNLEITEEKHYTVDQRGEIVIIEKTQKVPEPISDQKSPTKEEITMFQKAKERVFTDHAESLRKLAQRDIVQNKVHREKCNMCDAFDKWQCNNGKPVRVTAHCECSCHTSASTIIRKVLG